MMTARHRLLRNAAAAAAAAAGRGLVGFVDAVVEVLATHLGCCSAAALCLRARTA